MKIFLVGVIMAFLMCPANAKVCYLYRSAVTGQAVTKEYAQRHPRTTIRERCGATIKWR